jgi:hypothetical protein
MKASNVKPLHWMARKAEVKAIAKFALFLMSASAWNMRSLQAQQIATPPSTAACADPKSPHGSRKVAIAWLSDVKGEARLADSTGREFRPAYAHNPVTEGNVIQTVLGRAEVEFEDNSTRVFMCDLALRHESLYAPL